MKSTKILWLILLVIILPLKTFAAMPEISAEEKYVNLLKGHYILKGNVYVGLNNHGLKATVTADEARVNVLSQKCWTTGNVNFVHGNVLFKCEKAFLQWQTKTADVVGSVKFDSKGTVTISSDSATFNWSEKIADFFGRVTITPGSNLMLADNLTVENVTYAHVRYDVRQNKILQLDKTFLKSGVTIPASDVTD